MQPSLRVTAVVPVVAILTACAARGSTATQDAVQVQEAARVIAPGTPGGVIQTRAVAEDLVRSNSVPGSPERIFGALPAVYDELKLPLTQRHDAQRQLGAQGRRVRGSIGGTRMSLLFNCGAGVTGGDAADSYELTIDVVSQVLPGETPSEATLRTMASGIAKPVMTSGEPVRCVSTGRLEEKIAEAVVKRSRG